MGVLTLTAAVGCAHQAGPAASGPPSPPISARTETAVTAAPVSAAPTARAPQAFGTSPVPTPPVSATPRPALPTARQASESGAWVDGEGTDGFDVSRYQETVDWVGLVASGHRFVYVKATEGTNHISPTHAEQRQEARASGLVQGGYHYARPNQSTGTLQARFFGSNGGAWTPDGRTLPGALDLEFATSGDQCYGLTPEQMVQWVRDFSDEYVRVSGRVPVIYTKAIVWDTCTRGNTSFGDHPLWLYDHARIPGDLPSGWTRPTLWQRAVQNDLDRNVFFGDEAQLTAWATRR